MNMFQQYLAAKGLGIYPALALLLFIAASLGVAGYVVFVLKGKDLRDRLSSLPLEGDGAATDGSDAEGRNPAS